MTPAPIFAWFPRRTSQDEGSAPATTSSRPTVHLYRRTDGTPSHSTSACDEISPGDSWWPMYNFQSSGGYACRFQPVGRLPQQDPRRGHFLVNSSPNGTHAFPERKDNKEQNTGERSFCRVPDLTRPSGVPREVRHNTIHHIKTTPGPPVSCRPRRFAPDRLAIAKAEFDAMLKDGTARRSDGPWSSALHIVPKKDNGW